MNKIYSIDECNNLNTFLEVINKWQNEGRIEFVQEEFDTYKILDINLDEDEEIELLRIFNELDIYEVGDIEDDDDWNPYYDDDEYNDYY